MPRFVLEVALGTPLLGLILCALVSGRLAARSLWVLGVVPPLACAVLWHLTQPAIVLPISLISYPWLSSLSVDFELAVTTTRLVLLVACQAVFALALWLNRHTRSSVSTPLLFFGQFASVVLFTSQNLILSVAALECVYGVSFLLAWLGIAPSQRHLLVPALAFLAVSSACFLFAASLFGVLYQEHFQVFSVRWSDLLDLGPRIAAQGGDYSWDRSLFWILAVGTVLRAPLAPAHGWYRAVLESQNESGRILFTALPLPILIHTWLQWIVPTLPDAYAQNAPLLSLLCGASALYMAILASRCRSLVDWLSFSSPFHNAVGFSALLAFSIQSMAGAVLLAIVWCFIGGCFAWLSSLAQKAADGALSKPLAVCLLLLLLATAGLPGSGAFSALLLVFTGTLKHAPWLSIGLCLAWAFSVWSVLNQARLAMAVANHGNRSLLWAPGVIVLAFLGAVLWIGIRPDALRTELEPGFKSLLRSRLKAFSSPISPGGSA